MHGGSRILKRVPVCDLSVCRVLARGVWGQCPPPLPPRKNLDFWPSEIVSGVFLGINCKSWMTGYLRKAQENKCFHTDCISLSLAAEGGLHE